MYHTQLPFIERLADYVDIRPLLLASRTYAQLLKNPMIKNKIKIRPAESFLNVEVDGFRLTNQFLQPRYLHNILKELFQMGTYVAGGAALFAYDYAQDFEHVSDIDVWVPFEKKDEVQEYLDAKHASGVDKWDNDERLYGSHPPTPITKNERIWIMDMNTFQPNQIFERFTFQFIFMEEGATIYDVLEGFDFSVVQCALVSMNRMICSHAFMRDVRTRNISYFNQSQVPMREMAEYWSMRLVHRVEKYMKKGFKIDLRKLIEFVKRYSDYKCLPNELYLKTLHESGEFWCTPVKNDREFFDLVQTSLTERKDWFDYNTMFEADTPDWVCLMHP